jgi:chorismate lyase/3-hydroxybenzoate synthase
VTGRHSNSNVLAGALLSEPATCDVPPWVVDFVSPNGSLPPWRPHPAGFAVRRVVGPRFGLWSLRVPDVLRLDEAAFEQVCADAYRALEAGIDPQGPRYPVRLWNFVPDILAPLGTLAHRYMVFNAGRFRAFGEWLGEEALSGRLATASGVGHSEDQLVLHCLCATEPGRPVENPRQIAAWRYSQRYGPKPPCFARATSIVDAQGQPWLLVGGTASVRGEDSWHVGDLSRQLDETLHNLAAVAAAAVDPLAVADPAALDLSPERRDTLLRRYRHLRVYVVRPSDRASLQKDLRRHFGPQTEIELVDADLCRPDLLVEIEGLARL